MAVRAKDVAKKIGVSEATLSLVINEKPGISDKTRHLVKKKLKNYGYSYMLRKNDSDGSREEQEAGGRTLGFVLFRDHGELMGVDSFFPYIVSGLEQAAGRYGYALTVINIEKSRIQTELQYIRSSGCDGFVVFATEMKEDSLAAFRSVGIPFILFDNEFADPGVNCVAVNNRQGTAQAVRFLVSCGHTRIGYLSSGLDIGSFQERRKFAWMAAMDEGAEDMRKYTYSIGYPHENAEDGMGRLLASVTQGELPTAFLADNDLVAAGAMRAMKSAGYRVPDDFSVIGFDDRPICTLLTPRLTTVMIPRELFGGIAVERLVHVLRGEAAGEVTIRVDGKLVLRESVLDRRQNG